MGKILHTITRFSLCYVAVVAVMVSAESIGQFGFQFRYRPEIKVVVSVVHFLHDPVLFIYPFSQTTISFKGSSEVWNSALTKSKGNLDLISVKVGEKRLASFTPADEVTESVKKPKKHKMKKNKK